MDIYELVTQFYKAYKGKKAVYGKSQAGRNLYAFFVGKRADTVGIIQCAIHGREYITAYLGLKLIEKAGHLKGGAWIIPLANPDGVAICQKGFSNYKANANGVDLNTNFDANWGRGERNRFTKGQANYVGEFAFSEPESVALRDFTLMVMPRFTISYHSKGQEIYFDFGQVGKNYARDKKIATVIAKQTGYKIVEGLKSAGGYKDWCVDKLKISAFTIEVGKDSLSHPIERGRLGSIYKQNKKVLKRVFAIYER